MSIVRANPATPRFTSVLRRSRSPHQRRKPASPTAQRCGAGPRWWMAQGPIATQTVMGFPKELPAGLDKSGYIKLTAAAKLAAPSWTEDDFFVI